MQVSKKAIRIGVMEMVVGLLCARILEESGLLEASIAGVKDVDFLASMECTRLLRSIETG